MRPIHYVVSCEHGGNLVPKAYQHLFQGEEHVLESHKGWDIGALVIAKQIANILDSRLIYNKICRLLVECNRSEDSPELFSSYSQKLKDSVKEYILEQYYYPYREKVEDHIQMHLQDKRVIHLSIHTFTPIWHGTERMVDIGLLFDDNRSNEIEFCSAWKNAVRDRLPEYTTLLNVPYHGADDGFTTYLRKQFPEDHYLGIEIEINQKWVGSEDLTRMVHGLTDALGAAFMEGQSV